MSLLEIMLAISIVVITLSALVTIATTATRSADSSRGHTIADQYAREAVEHLRYVRDNEGWRGLLRADPVSPLARNRTQYYSLNSEGELKYRTGSISGNICNGIRNSLYQIKADSEYYRVIKMSLNNAMSEVQIEVSICHGYRNGRASRVFTNTVLTNWR